MTTTYDFILCHRWTTRRATRMAAGRPRGAQLFLHQSGGRAECSWQCHGRRMATQLPFQLLPLQPMALLAVSVVLRPPSATASEPAGELYGVCPDQSRAVPDRVNSRYRGGRDQVVPI